MFNSFIHKREASTQLILQVGLELFAENGYHPTTIRMIAEKAGISLGLLYNYFKSKEEVLRAIFKKNIKNIEVDIISSTEPTRQITLGDFTRIFLKNLKSNRNFWLLLYNIKLSRTTLLIVAAEIKELGNALQETLEDCLGEADIPFPSLEAKFILASLDGVAQHFLMQDNFPVNDIINLLLMKYQPANSR